MQIGYKETLAMLRFINLEAAMKLQAIVEDKSFSSKHIDHFDITPQDWLQGSFVFNETIEGFDYWKNVCKFLEAYYNTST